MTTIDKHPCFNPAVKGRFGRVHLPVAPKCNIKCNYCDRKYDCVNESRPGVTSTVLSPHQALVYVERVLAAEPRISVAGIAGPGDPFANPEATLDTMSLLREHFPDLILCLSSNGLALAEHADTVADIGVSHVTVTVNTVDPAIGARIYAWARDGKILYRGAQAAELLWARQEEAISRLKRRGVTVKVNTIIIPGVNDHHVEAVARTMRALGVDLLNCMALFPNPGTAFADLEEPDVRTMAAIRARAERFLPQMRHCTRCRADAVGLLGHDKSGEMRSCLSACATLPAVPPDPERPRLAVASLEGVLINQHLGEAKRLLIYERDGDTFRLLEERPTPEPGCGPKRWLRLARLLGDCRALLTSGIGDTPQDLLSRAGVQPLVMSGFIDMGLAAAWDGNPAAIAAMKGRETSCADRPACAGGGGGCV